LWIAEDFLGAALQADGETRSECTASSIRRRSAAWTILLDWMFCIVASEPEALLAVLKNPAYHFKRIGLEAGPLSQWLFSVLAEAELPVVCVETRHIVEGHCH
jgi:hypothetical protein